MLPIEYVFFDLGNVLLHFDHEIVVQNLVNLTQVAAGDIRQALFGSGLEDRYELGQLSSKSLIEQLSNSVGRPLDYHPTLHAISDMFNPNHAMVEVLEYVRAAQIPMGLLSNTCDAHWSWVQQNQYRTVEGWFNHHVLSYRVQAMKPAKLIYEYAEKLAGVPPAAIFFTDDRIDNVLAARAAGWQAEQFISASELLAQLRDRLR